tara:strand:+ start:531 stop:2747 length:2217 start_codon:yes stop_codon:yes gene_type:complete
MCDSNTRETHEFSADINQLMNIIINTFYSNKEIFLRELISNSSDAIDKIRYDLLQNNKSNNENYHIHLTPNADNKTLTIEDNGIGMTRDDLINNIGTIAKSGTKAFTEALQAGADVNMIGQFGVGFYSSYLVADKVVIQTRSHLTDKTYSWESTASGSFTIDEVTDENKLESNGTRIILHLKDEHDRYLDKNRLIDLVKKHSQFINYPISVWVQKTREVEVTDEDNNTECKEEECSNEDTNVKSESKEENECSNEECKDDDCNKVEVEDVDDENDNEKNEPEPKTKTETYHDWDLINTQKPIWCRNKSEITEDEYNQFYKSLPNKWDNPLTYKHFSAEGQIEYKSILYIPSQPAHTMFEQNKKNCDIKLYVRRVFITDDYKELIPDYLSFITGIVDSNDLPLNISREMLQENKIMRIIKKNLVKKCIEMMHDIPEDKYDSFYANYSKNIKLGVYEDETNREKLMKLLRFNTSKSLDKMISLDEYVERMKENQKVLYYIAGESVETVNTSPCLEALRGNGFEVLYFIEPIDEYMCQSVKKYMDYDLVCITKDNLKLNENEEEKEKIEQQQKEYKKLCEYIKTVLENEVQDVRLSQRLSDSPCILVSQEHSWSANMERILKAQALRDTSMDGMLGSKKIMEINPNNKSIQNLKNFVETDDKNPSYRNFIWLMYESSMLSSGFALRNPGQFSKRINKLVAYGLNADDDDDDDDIPDLPETTAEVNKSQDEELEESSMEHVD